MKTYKLNTTRGRAKFIKDFDTLQGQKLANKLGISGKGCQEIANKISAFVWNLRTANVCRKHSGTRGKYWYYRKIAEDAIKNLPNEIKERFFK